MPTQSSPTSATAPTLIVPAASASSAADPALVSAVPNGGSVVASSLPTTQDPGAPVNPSSPGGLIGENSAGDESLPDYGLDKDSLMEAEDGSTRTIGTLLAQTDLSTAKTQDLTVNGSDAATKTSYKGDVSDAAVVYQDDEGNSRQTTPAAAAQASVQNTELLQDMSVNADGQPGNTSYRGDVSQATVTWGDGSDTYPLDGILQYTYPLTQDAGTPSSPKAVGSRGQVTADDKYLYVCAPHGGDTWVRIPYDTTWT